MSVWKTFCRLIESKLVRKHFGDLVPLVERCAIFEFNAEQLARATAYEPPAGEDPVPPFPFPQLCCVGPGGVLLLREPTMDEETGMLSYEAIAGHADGRTLQVATCIVDTRSAWPLPVEQARSLHRRDRPDGPAAQGQGAQGLPRIAARRAHAVHRPDQVRDRGGLAPCPWRWIPCEPAATPSPRPLPHAESRGSVQVQPHRVGPGVARERPVRRVARRRRPLPRGLAQTSDRSRPSKGRRLRSACSRNPVHSGEVVHSDPAPSTSSPTRHCPRSS